ncbi:MAG: CidA/LrgA family protein [Betaproteobacteria bacterium]
MSPFLIGVTWLLVFQCAGEGATRLFDLPVPGPVIAMLALFVVLRFRKQVPESLGVAADGLARHLSLLFVPAGVGVMLHFARLAENWVPILTALFVSTILTIAAAGWTFSALKRWALRDEDELPSRTP